MSPRRRWASTTARKCADSIPGGLAAALADSIGLPSDTTSSIRRRASQARRRPQAQSTASPSTPSR